MPKLSNQIEFKIPKWARVVEQHHDGGWYAHSKVKKWSNAFGDYLPRIFDRVEFICKGIPSKPRYELGIKIDEPMENYGYYVLNPEIRCIYLLSPLSEVNITQNS